MKSRRLITVLTVLALLGCGENPENPSQNMTIDVTQPPQAGAQADSTYTIAWETSNPDAGAAVSLAYDTDKNPSSGTVPIQSGLSATDSYQWDCSLVTPGTYYIYALVAGASQSTSAYSDGGLTITHSGSGPMISVLQPPAAGAQADSTYEITWQTWGFDSTVTVDLYYDSDTTVGDTTKIAGGLEDDGSFLWECSDIPSGQYYILAVASDDTVLRGRGTARGTTHGPKASAMDYSDGSLEIYHGGSLPQISITEPSQSAEPADTSYMIQWTSIPSGGTDTVDLYYDTDTQPGAGLVQIASGIGDSGNYSWDCSGVEEGEYYIYGEISSSSSSHTGTSYSSGTVLVSHGSSGDFQITHPPASGAQADSSYTLQWTSQVSPDSTLDLYYSADTTGSTLFSIVGDTPNTGSYFWNTSGIDEGSWYIYGVLKDGTDGSVDWSDGPLTIDHSGPSYTMEVTAPPASGATSDTTYTIQWTAQGSDSAVVDLYYDIDTDPSDMLEIEMDLDNTGSYQWNTLPVSEGSYYIYAVIRDPGTESGPTDAWAADYSDGTLTVQHSDFYILVIAPPGWGAFADDEYTIQWSALAPAGSLVDLFYDDDTQPGSGLVPIESGISWDDYEYLWDTSALPNGEYWVYAILDDQMGNTYSDYSDSTLTVFHGLLRDGD